MITGAIVDTVGAMFKPLNTGEYHDNNEAHLAPGRGTEGGIYQAAQESYLGPW